MIINAHQFIRKRIYALLLLTFYTGVNAFAYDFKYEGINYSIISKENKTVAVSYNPSYSGNVDIPETVSYDDIIYSVSEIESSAFHECTELTSVTIPNSITGIGDKAFDGCTNLAVIRFPDNIISKIGSNAFDNTMWMENQPDGIIYIGKVAYSYKGEWDHYRTQLIIKEGTEVIAQGAFNTSGPIKSVVLPEGLRIINDNAFNIGNLKDGVIDIPQTVTYIGNKAIRCYDLKTLIVHYKQPELITVDKSAFLVPHSRYDSPDYRCKLVVPRGTKKAYKAVEPWNEFKIVYKEKNILGVSLLFWILASISTGLICWIFISYKDDRD